jgi:hypothetical protein
VCKSIIDNPCNVDAGTVAAFKSAALRFVHTQYDDETEGLEALYHDDGELGSSLRKAVEVIDEADRAADITKAHKHRGPHELGASLIQHLHDRLDRHRERHGYYTKAAKESPMSSLQDIAKSHGVPGVVLIAKNIVDEQKSFRVTEEEFCRLIDTAARVTHPELGARAFEKIYERNPLLARAIAVIKAGLAEQLLSGGMPVLQVGGVDATHEAINNTEQSEAYAQLEAMASKLRASSPWLSAEQAFAKAFEANPTLAAKAHRRPTAPAGGMYPFPR